MDYREIYHRQAGAYDELVAAEDCDGNLTPALAGIRSLDGAEVLEVGVGTGRITRLLAGRARRIVGVDRAPAMLAVARRHLQASPGGAAWMLACADAVALPVRSSWADVAIAGWVFGHLRSWMPAAWRTQIATAASEMRRALRPGGVMIIIETLGTGSVEPRPPTAELAEYYAWLEDELGMTRTSLRTDYAFADVDTAARVTGFFFGDDFAARVRDNRWCRVPECTGIWSRSA
jgi:ubiquinone/menaquinone biosynthesis C-methylase UbiE